MESQQNVDRYGVPIDFNNRQVQENGNGGVPLERRASAGMTEEEQQERRASIKAIMANPNLTATERRLSIQALMDGRRRSSCGGNGNGAVVSVASSNNASFPDIGQGAGIHPGMHANLMSRVDFSTMTEAQRTQAKAVQAAISRRMELNRPPCNHYDRNCTIISPCCGMAFGCRICHDECPQLPPPLLSEQPRMAEQTPAVNRYQRASSMPTSNQALPDSDNQHLIERFKIAEIICRQCFTRQGSKTNMCENCGIQLGEYHCIICNLWMSSKENPYHCDECGFCRVGGRENFRHCEDCGMCIDALLFEEHDCKVGKYMSNCPVCQEDLFSSRAASHEMPCGHAIHWHCFRELASYDSRCPVCKKTAETPERMASTWSAMAMGIALQPIPPEMAKVVDILCVDCEQQDEHRKWHFLGVQCRRCSSFNTVVERITMAGPEAANFTREHGDGAPRLPRISRTSRPGLVGGVSARDLSQRSINMNEGQNGELLDFEMSFATRSYRNPPGQDDMNMSQEW